MNLAHIIFVFTAFTLAGVEASVPRLKRYQKCELFGRQCKQRRLKAFMLRETEMHSKNWTQLAETELIDNRWRIVLPYVIISKYSDRSDRFWQLKSPGSGGRPASAKAWIDRVRPAIEEANKFYEPTNIFFKEYFQEDIDSGMFSNDKQYIVISDFYDTYSSGCSSDLGPSRKANHIEVDIERCRGDMGRADQYHPGEIAHEFMHVLGFLHEHQRRDRDDYITVNVPRWSSGNPYDFMKETRGVHLTAYDLESITHYPPSTFMKINEDNPKSVDMMTHMGQREKLSSLDVEQININYPVDAK